MRRTIFVAIITVGALALGMPVASAGTLKCFSGDPATCTVSGDTVTLDTSVGGFAGAYYSNSRNVGGTSLSGVTFSFQYDCDPNDNKTDCVGGGSPRWSIPIDTDGDSKTNAYAFVDAVGCGSTGVVSTESSSCAVFFDTGYANWAAFATAHPTYEIAHALPFVITDTTEPGSTLISDITITQA